MLLTLIRGFLRLLQRISPSAASVLAVRLFRTPRRFATPQREQELLRDAEPFDVPHGGGRIRAWSWGQGPLVILVHGWEGRGSQMGVFARPLAKAGFRVIAFDAHGHGQSSTRQSSLPEFTDSLRSVAESAGAPHAVVAHSFGCAATTLALKEGFGANRLVFIAPPLNPKDYTHIFGKMFGLSDPVVTGLQTRIEKRFNRKWSEYSLAETAPKMDRELLIVHDRDDDETSWEGGARLAELWPGARMMTTVGLGHRRVLRNPAVIEAVVGFVNGRD